MTADATFTRSARRPAPEAEGPTLQWATGLTTINRQVYAGWLVEAGKLDALDDAMRAAELPQVTIKHGSGNTVTHWSIETANVYLLADGVQSIGAMKRTEDRLGIAFGWRTLDGGRQQSVLRAQVLLRELCAVGWYEPITLSVKSTLTGDVIAACMRQYEVLDAIDAFRKLDNKPALNPPLYACALPLGPGVEVARGSGGQTKEITPPIANLPSPITKEYIRAMWCKREWCEAIEARMNAVIAWSIAESRRIAAGDAQPKEEYA